MEHQAMEKTKRVSLIAGWGSGAALVGCVVATVLSSGWLSDTPFKTPWMLWLFWVSAGLTAISIGAMLAANGLAPEKREPQLVIMGFLKGDNPQPIIGLVTFLALLYDVNLISALVAGGVVWWRAVLAVFAAVDIALWATLAVLRQANLHTDSYRLEETPVFVYPLSRPSRWTVDSLNDASPETLINNTFGSEAPDAAKSALAAVEGRRMMANINVLFGGVGFHAHKLEKVHVLLTTEVTSALTGSGHTRAVDDLKEALETKINEVIGVVDPGQHRKVEVMVHKCESGNDLELFRRSVEKELSDVLSDRRSTPNVTFDLTSGTSIVTAALLLTALKHGCQAEYVPQSNPPHQEECARPYLVPTTIGSIYDLAHPLMDGLGRE
ncbi:MAG: hypothetical protein ACPL2N_07485 [Candidatus Cryosericum sp.]